MSVAADAAGIAQPASFAFTPDNLAKARAIIAKYPAGRQASAVLALLDLAQRQHDNWLPRAAMDVVADMLEMARIRDLLYDVQSEAGGSVSPANLHDHALLAPRLGRGGGGLRAQAWHQDARDNPRRLVHHG
jgi:hypothetical protein